MAVEKVFASLLNDAHKKFGERGTMVGGSSKNIATIKLPIALCYLLGSLDGLPLGKIFGVDGLPSSWKSMLMRELGRIWAEQGGMTVYIENEEKDADRAHVAILYNTPLEQRRYFLTPSTSSVEEWQQMARHWLSKAKDLREAELAGKLTPSDRVPILVITDSLTAQALDTERKKIDTRDQGVSGAAVFGGIARNISKFFQDWSFNNTLMSFAYVQHAKVNSDQDAYGDDKLKSMGGDAPRFNAAFHLRAVSVAEDVKVGQRFKEVTFKCIKNSLGDDKRQARFRVGWKYILKQMPQIDKHGNLVMSDEYVPFEQGKEFFDDVNRFMSADMALQLRDFMGLDGLLERMQSVDQAGRRLSEIVSELEKIEANPKGKAKKSKALKDEAEELQALIDREDPANWRLRMPVLGTERVEMLRWDWDWALGWLIFSIVDKSAYSADDIKKLKEFIPVSTSNCSKGKIKAKKIFGDDNQRSFTELGRWIRDNPDVEDRLRRFLGIKEYLNFREVQYYESPDAKKAREKAAKQAGGTDDDDFDF